MWSNLVLVGGLTAGETLLVHGGSSGIGTMAIQVARAGGPRGGHRREPGQARGLPRARRGHPWSTIASRDFVDVVRGRHPGTRRRRHPRQHGAKYLPRNVGALATGGRLVIIGMQGGAKGELDIATLLRKRAAVHATSLRARPAEERQASSRRCASTWPMIASGRVRPIVNSTHRLADAAAAHRELEASGHVGKILLQP